MNAELWRIATLPGCADCDQSKVGQERVWGFMEAVYPMNFSTMPFGGRQEFGLTALERQVIALVGAGYTNKDIAEKLGINEKTAKGHLNGVLEKLGVANRLELVLFAAAQGLTEED
jgi:DNA-binding CsgD family transcriptional regulator